MLPQLMEAVGVVDAQVICDLCCGEGRVARLLARKGAQVVGIDLSVELLKAAEEKEVKQPLGINYYQNDAQTLEGVQDGVFDGVVCVLALMDLPDLAATIASVRRVLKSSGWFTFLITHPCFASPQASADVGADGSASWQIYRYFEEGFWSTDRGGNLCAQVGAYHRTLSTYLGTVAAFDFVITDVVEPKHPKAAEAANPGHQIVPLLLLVKCIKK